MHDSQSDVFARATHTTPLASDKAKYKNISKDLFSIGNKVDEHDPAISKQSHHNYRHQHPHETPSETIEKNKNAADDFGDLMARRMNTDYISTSTPTHTPAKHGHHVNNASIKNSSNYSLGTPTNRSGGGNSSRNSYSMRSQKSPNDSRSFDNSSFTDSPTTSPFNVSQRFSSHEKSREPRRTPNSPICLSEFVTAATPAKTKRRRSANTSQDGSIPGTNMAKQQNLNRSSDKDFPAFTPKGKAIARITPTPTPTPAVPLANATASNTPQLIKPVKRVVPTLISSNRNDFTSSTFRSDNNILEVTHEETDISRDILKTQKDVLRQVFMDEKQSENNIRVFLKNTFSVKANVEPAGPPIDLTKITNEDVLHKLIRIYAIILDLNLITNILNEIAFLVNLINVDSDQYCENNPQLMITAKDIDEQQQQQQKQPKKPQESHQMAEQILPIIFKNINNCVYFGLGVLKYQKHLLCLLDVTSLKVLLENDRLSKFGQAIKDELFRTYAHKSQLELSISSHDTPLKIGHSSQVFYQQEQDTKKNFPTAQEFTAFKKQRDAFYTILG